VPDPDREKPNQPEKAEEHAFQSDAALEQSDDFVGRIVMLPR